MTEEPVYRFVKGAGWIPESSVYLITEQDCEDWDRSYPNICEGWEIKSRNDLKPGDVIPFGPFVRVVLEINDRFVTWKTYHYKNRKPSTTETVERGLYWSGVARRV